MTARILIVEDNQANLDLMAFLLKAFGHTVLIARNGVEGLEVAQQELLDLIICDVHMPTMDGYEMARQLKKHPAQRRIPLVAVTALAMVGDRDKVIAAGFDGYISKPIAPRTFVKDVEVFLQAHHHSTFQPGGPPAQPQPPRAKHATILVVDNSPINLSLARSTLEPFGYEVITAENIEEGLRLARQSPPDLILSNLHMPHRNGFDFIRAVKADPQLCFIPFFFISSTVFQESDRQSGLALGADGFILRPIKPQALLAEIEACLRETGDRETRRGGNKEAG